MSVSTHGSTQYRSDKPLKADSRLLAKIQSVSRIAAVGVMSLASVALAGWLFQIPTLKSLLPGLAPMAIKTALGLFLSGLSLWLWQCRSGRTLARGCGVGVLLLGALTLGEYGFEWMLGALRATQTERMAPHTALGLVLSGAALWLLPLETRRGHRPAQWLALGTGLIAFIELTGYVYSAIVHYHLASYTGMAVHTALSLGLLCVGLLCVFPAGGLMTILISPTRGGSLARRLWPATFLTLFFLNWLAQLGARADWYAPELVSPLAFVANSIVLIALIGWNAFALHNADIAQAEAEARAHEQRKWFEITLKSIGDAVITVDTQNRVAFMNPIAEALTGWQSREALGQHLEQVLQLVDRHAHRGVENPVTQVMQEDLAVDLPLHTRLVAKDGTERPIDDSVAAIRDSQGNVIGAVLVFRDITERQRAEAALRESEECFRLLVDGVRDYALVMLDSEGRIVNWNAGAAAMHGWSAAEAIGQPVSLVYTLEARDHDQPRRDLDWAAAQGRYAGESQRMRKDGSVFWAEVILTALRDAEGHLRGFAEVTRDLTVQKQAERQVEDSRARLNSIVELAMDAIITIDAEQRIVLFNKAAEKIFGVPAVDALGRPLERFISEHFRRAHHEHLRTFGEGDGAKRVMGRQVTLRALRANGEEFPIEASISQTDVGGQKLLTVILRDITERVRADQALREADRRKNEFLAMLGHELRNPLAPIRNAVQVMKKVHPASPKHLWAQQMIERQVKHLGRLVDDLLDVSRIIQGKISLQKVPIELADVLHQALETSHPLIDARRHKLIVSLPDQSVRLIGDGLRLAQVVSNLLTNAAKYTPEGGTIWLTAAREQDEAVISVRDTGEGIPEALLPHLFDLFTQAERTLDRAQGGLGIGLTLVKTLVELHEGRIEAKSGGPGKGSEFIVRLPLSEEPGLTVSGLT